MIDVLGSIFNLLGTTFNVLEPLIGFLSEALNVVLMPIVATLEVIVKTISTVIYALDALLSWNWDGLCSKLNDLWSNWGTSDFVKNVKFDYFANGGLPDKGTRFYAGERGAEIVYNTPSGQSVVANVQQIAQATYAGTT